MTRHDGGSQSCIGSVLAKSLARTSCRCGVNRQMAASAALSYRTASQRLRLWGQDYVRSVRRFSTDGKWRAAKTAPATGRAPS